MDRVFGFSILSLIITGILLVPFIDFLYKIKLQRKDQKTKDFFNQRAKIFDKLSSWKVGTPFGGGLLIIAVVTALTLWAYTIFQIHVKFLELFVLLFTFIGFGALGFYDDLRKIFHKNTGIFGLKPLHKFIIQWILALIIGFALYSLGYSFVYIHWFGQITLGIFYIFFSSLVIVSFTNAFNIADGLDGLSTGLFIICLVAFLAISGAILDPFLTLFIAILLGSSVAFLYFNIYKARLWLGDVGSLSLGAVLAVIGLLTGRPLSVAIVGGVFVIEVGSVLLQIISRKFFHRRILPVAPLHLYFLKRGWEEPKVVMRAWLLGVVFAIFGLYIAFIH